MVSTTIEQSRNLSKLGLSAETADMHYKETKLFGGNWILCPYGISYYYEHELPTPAMYVPSWSLSALIDLLPNEIKVGVDKLCLMIDKYESDWYVRYLDKNGNGIGYRKQKLIDSVYNVICYLIEEKLI